MERYEPDVEYIGTGDYVAKMVKAPEGDYILYANHQADLAEKDAEIVKDDMLIDQLKREIAEIKFGMKCLEDAILAKDAELVEAYRRLAVRQYGDLQLLRERYEKIRHLENDLRKYQHFWEEARMAEKMIFEKEHPEYEREEL